MDYRWGRGPRGQYVDGHERKDVVTYHQTVFLPTLARNDDRIRTYDTNGDEIPYSGPRPMKHRLVIWFHDKSTFYANDQRRVYWVHKDEKAVPEPKGEGPSLMVVDFVSADHGWLGTPDAEESALVYFKAGKDQDGYFTNKEIVAQLEKAMDLVKKMPKGPSPSCPDTQWFGVDVKVKDADGRLVYGPDGKPLKHRVKMGNAKFADGSTQYLYYPDTFPEHPELAGKFKGMAQLLIERHPDQRAKIKGLRMECSKFKCPNACCFRRRTLQMSSLLLWMQAKHTAFQSCSCRNFIQN
ncbi:uncharacterized protein C8Q71DRAFT_727129 [Rhodofomes roseus]|uniref:EF-hand domain-containing protein n=1 Tax=Rhodofomes roseus TaxID=34475 RepID=A0ABQ8K2F0_9APHY|nr:uncharacterized protein C8Q71DRAFT_727129 [Rhodofomes roseus]KAH9830937.1 hypothetical protein C8Q71DRAFT_727129 [Rhodofomes roseus]